jgi:tRNA(His) 5'-end guanylyltransferase
MAKNTKLTQRGIGELQRSCERYENYNDGFILPDTFLVVRLDAHRYGDWSGFADDYPTGPAATKAFLITARALMSATFRVVLSYVHGDEISLVVDPTENNNPLRRSKLISAFSSAAAVHFFKSAGLPALFDAKVSELTSVEKLVEYLFWQRRYCYRNATTIALRKALLQAGHTPEKAEAALQGSNDEQRVAQLKSLGAPVEMIPHTTRRGSLLYWETEPQGGREHARVVADMKLTDDDEMYEAHIRRLIEKALQLPAGAPSKPVHAPSSTSAPVVTKAKITQPTAPPRASQPPPSVPKKNKKAHVSVFRVPPASHS